MSKNILFATDLNVWSIGKGIGAPSFYKTLELYNNKGYSISLYTTENNCDIKELENIKIIKIPKLKILNIKYTYTINKLFNYFLYQVIFFYFFIKNKEFKKNNLLYGYEIEFIPILFLLAKLFDIPLVSRFQGTILYPEMKKIMWKIKYFPHYFSIKLKSNFTIMTDDGTKGDVVVKKIRNDFDNVLFIKNGVDFRDFYIDNVSEKIKKIAAEKFLYEKNFITVSRLQRWKRVDRSLDVFNFVNTDNNCRILIVGDGDDKDNLEKLVLDKKIKNVIFVGGINSDEVNYLLKSSEIFLSHYEISNVGNPLWEAMKNDCLVVTINNGDTGVIIKDKFNGIISSEENYLDNGMKIKFIQKNEVEHILQNAKKTLKSTVISWGDRMDVEYKFILGVLK